MGWLLIVKFWPLLPPAINCLYMQSYQKFLPNWVVIPCQPPGAKVPTDSQVLGRAHLLG